MLTKLKLIPGKRAKHRDIYICERVKAVGTHNFRAMLGSHHFTDADWGGKFVWLSKKTWMTAFLSLNDNDPIIETISRLVEGHISMSTDDASETTHVVPTSITSLDTFVCKVVVVVVVVVCFS